MRAGDGLIIVIFGSFIPLSTKKLKNAINFGPPLTKLSGSAHILSEYVGLWSAKPSTPIKLKTDIVLSTGMFKNYQK